MKAKYFIITFLLFFSWNISAQTIISDRPGQSDFPDIVEKGNFQIESGFLIEYAESDNMEERYIQAPSNILRFGLMKNLELRVLNQYESVKDRINDEEINGMSNLQLGFKLNLYGQQYRNLKLSFLSHFIINSGSSDLRRLNRGIISKLCFLMNLNNKVSFGTNLGSQYADDSKADFFYSFVFSIVINKLTSIYIEPYGTAADLDSNILKFNSGFSYLLNDNIQLDFSFGTGINQISNYISTGISWQFRNKANQNGPKVNNIL